VAIQSKYQCAVLSEELALPNNALGMNFTVRGRQVGLFSVGLGLDGFNCRAWKSFHLTRLSFMTTCWKVSPRWGIGWQLTCPATNSAAALDTDPPSRCV